MVHGMRELVLYIVLRIRTISVLSFCHQQVRISEAVVGRVGENEEQKSIWNFEKNITVGSYYTYLGYRPLKANGNTLEETNIQLIRHDACPMTMLKSFEHEEKRSGHRKKVYLHTFTSHMSIDVNQTIGHVCKFVQIQEPEELKWPPKLLREI